MLKQERDEHLSAKQQHTEELERQIKSLNEELNVEKQKLLAMQEVSVLHR